MAYNFSATYEVSQFTLKSEYEQLINDKGYNYFFTTLIRRISNEVGFTEITKSVNSPFIRFKEDSDTSFCVNLYNIVEIKIIKSHLQRWRVNVYKHNKKRLLNEARTLYELNWISRSFNKLMLELMNTLVIEIVYKTFTFLPIFHHIKKLYEDIITFEPNAFFSYDDKSNVFFYLPSCNLFVSSRNRTYQDHKGVFGTSKPSSMTGLDYLRLGKVNCLSVNTRLYNASHSEELRKKLNHLKLLSNFEKENKDDPFNIIYNHSIDNLSLRMTASAELLSPVKDIGLRRTINDEYLITDDRQKAIILCKDIGDGLVEMHLK